MGICCPCNHDDFIRTAYNSGNILQRKFSLTHIRNWFLMRTSYEPRAQGVDMSTGMVGTQLGSQQQRQICAIAMPTCHRTDPQHQHWKFQMNSYSYYTVLVVVD